MPRFSLLLGDADGNMAMVEKTGLGTVVLPERPEGTEHLDEEALANLVTRNSIIGVEKIKPPQAKGFHEGNSW